ncbi:MAG: nucleoside-diphosphate kinase [Puniceicoccales bacterium]|jgi:nucleoside-diphosphate kinase|nr:nucleoside-diphosphate kinase [Puniceicoccales bacterium]
MTLCFISKVICFENVEFLKPKNGTFMEKSLIILKPDCMQRKLAGQVISKLENVGLKPIACKIINLDDNLLKEHYSHLTHLPFFPEIVEFMSSSPVMVIIFEGENAVERIRNILGPTDSQKAPAGTIRGDFGLDKMRNIAHASDSKDAAEKEIARFFK